jgi:hypothetical protein
MKTINQLLILMTVVLLSFSFNSCNSDRKITKHTIKLYVDTDSINQQNIDATCNFGQVAGVSNEDFLTNVGFGDKITWIGVSSSSPGKDKVKIKKIKYVSGDDILTNREKGNSWFSPKVRGKVNKKDRFDLTKKNIEKYSIEFKVFHKGNKATFIIDPKLQVIN